MNLQRPTEPADVVSALTAFPEQPWIAVELANMIVEREGGDALKILQEACTQAGYSWPLFVSRCGW